MQYFIWNNIKIWSKFLKSQLISGKLQEVKIPGDFWNKYMAPFMFQKNIFVVEKWRIQKCPQSSWEVFVPVGEQQHGKVKQSSVIAQESCDMAV